MDLHGNSNYVAIMDSKGKRSLQKKLPNDRGLILETLQPHRAKISGIAVESTYNWYWLVDTLMEAGYCVHLANPSAIQRYSGLKYADDQHDTFWLAEMLRKRGHLVKLRTSLIISLQNIISRNCGLRLNVNKVKELKKNQVSPLF